MTNGEKIKEIFPNVDTEELDYDVFTTLDGNTLFTYDWWNAEYKEPTTRNDLVVDCIDRQAAITFVCKNTEEILKDTMPLEVKLSDNYLYENVAKIMRNPKVLPPVTPIKPKGHWIEVLGGCKCSCCDMAFSRLKETCADNYCPNCGSDNREVKE